MELTVVALGGEVSYSGKIAKKFFGKDSNIIPTNSFRGVFDSVTNEKAHFGIIPFEDSMDGVFPQILDLLREYDLFFVAEVHMDIKYYLLGRGNPEDLKVIGSHPKALEYCRRYLDRFFPKLSRVITSSTSEAAYRASIDSTFGAIADKEVTKIYKELKVLSEEPHDHYCHTTAFKILAKHPLQWKGKPKGKLIWKSEKYDLAAYEE
jgi:chorismate mutase/prephenate dehydratase